MALDCKNQANWTCQNCGRVSAPQAKDTAHMMTVAHVDHDSENPDARLVCLCTRCHLQWDHKLHEICSRHTQRRRRRLELGYKKRYNKK